MPIVRVHVVPSAKIDGFVGLYGDALKIKLRAPAIEGKANEALIHFLARQLKIPLRSIALERGHKSRDKVIRLEGLTKEDVRTRMRCL